MEFKMDQRLKHKTWNCKALRGKYKDLHDIGLGNDFLAVTPITQERIAKINKWNYIKF